jgi:hypothetical protein
VPRSSPAPADLGIPLIPAPRTAPEALAEAGPEPEPESPAELHAQLRAVLDGQRLLALAVCLALFGISLVVALSIGTA